MGARVATGLLFSGTQSCRDRRTGAIRTGREANSLRAVCWAANVLHSLHRGAAASAPPGFGVERPARARRFVLDAPPDPTPPGCPPRRRRTPSCPSGSWWPRNTPPPQRTTKRSPPAQGRRTRISAARARRMQPSAAHERAGGAPKARNAAPAWSAGAEHGHALQRR